MAKRGRPVALDARDRTVFCGLIGLGHTLQDAASLLGVSPLTIRRLANIDPQFRENWKSAEYSLALAPLKTIRDEAQTNWKAATWLMERVHNTRFGKRQPKHCYPEDYNAFLKEYTELVLEVVSDDETRQRLQARLEKLMRLWDGEWSGGRGWYAKVKRESRNPEPSSAQQVAPATQPAETKPSSDAQGPPASPDTTNAANETPGATDSESV